MTKSNPSKCIKTARIAASTLEVSLVYETYIKKQTALKKHAHLLPRQYVFLEAEHEWFLDRLESLLLPKMG